MREWKISDNGNFKDDVEDLLELAIEAVHRSNALTGLLTLAAEIVNKKEDLIETSRYFRAPYAQLVGQIIKQRATKFAWA